MFDEEVIEEGVVVEIKNGLAVIEIIESEACEECSAKIYCKPKKDEDSKKRIEVLNPLNAPIGKRVKFSIKGKEIIKASLSIYGIALLIVLTGILIGMEIFNSYKELYSSLFALSLASIFFIIKYYYNKIVVKSLVLAKIISILD